MRPNKELNLSQVISQSPLLTLLSMLDIYERSKLYTHVEWNIFRLLSQPIHSVGFLMQAQHLPWGEEREGQLPAGFGMVFGAFAGQRCRSTQIYNILQVSEMSTICGYQGCHHCGPQLAWFWAKYSRSNDSWLRLSLESHLKRQQ